MKNKMQDVRNHLVAMMEALNDKDVDQELVDRAKAMAELSQAYTNTVKVELDARRMAGIEELPAALGAPDPVVQAVPRPQPVAKIA